MKKILVFLLISILCVTVGCKKKDKDKGIYELDVVINKTTIEVGDFGNYIVKTNAPSEMVEYACSNDCLEVNGSTYKAVKAGSTELVITVGELEKRCSIIVTEKKNELTITATISKNVLEVGETATINVTTNCEKYLIECNNDVVSVKDNVVTALKVGTATLYVKGDGAENMVTLNITVNPKKPTLEVSLSKSIIEVGEQATLNIEVTDYDVNNVSISCLSDIILIDGNTITGVEAGTATITVSIKEFNIRKNINITVTSDPDEEAPEFNLTVDKDMIVAWGQDFDPMEGVTAVDEIDGDLTENIVIEGTVDNKNYGEYEINYSVTDEAGNTATMKRTITVKWNYNVKFIGHAGSYYGVQNSEEACLYAVQELKYQALECDLKVTSDGVFVLCHDDTFAGKNIASTTFAELSKLEATSSRTGGYPKDNGEMAAAGFDGHYKTHILTLERYLEICKEYNVEAIIELKGCTGISGTTLTNMPKLMKLIEDMDMLDNVVFLASNYHALIWVKENGYEYIPCQYLVNGAQHQEYLDRCIKYGFDLSLNVTYGEDVDEAWIRKYQAAGCKVSTWTFTQYCDYDMVQKWINFGVDYLTCDWQRMEKLNLKPALKTGIDHTVKYYDYDGTLLLETEVADGKAAKMPAKKLERTGYNFVGWDKDTSNVTANLEVHAVYEAIKYSVTYEPNLYVVVDGNKYYLTRTDYVGPTTWLEYTINDEFNLPVPTTTLKFIGWYKDAACTNKLEKIASGSTGDLTLYAKWENLEYTEYKSKIEYVLDDGTMEGNPTEYVEGKVLTLAPAVKAGYDFVGWALSPDSEEVFNEISDHTTGDLTLYAVYKYHEYSITYDLNGGTWYTNPKAVGTPILTMNTTSNGNYWTDYNLYVFLHTASAYPKAKFSGRVYLKKLTGNFFEFVWYSASGKDNYTGEYDYVITCGESNSKYSTVNKAGGMAIGTIVELVGNISSGVTTVNFYNDKDVQGLEKPVLIEKYTIETLPVALPICYCDGKKFIGWSLTKDGEVITSIPKGTLGDLVLYARFE